MTASTTSDADVDAASRPRRKAGRPPASKGVETRALIIATAMTVWTHDGYEEGTLERVAAEAGLTRTAVYHYFPSKAALARAVLQTSGPTRWEWWLESTDPGRSLAGKLRAVLEASMRCANASPVPIDLWFDLVRASSNDPDLRMMLNDQTIDIRSSIEAIVQESIDEGELPEDSDGNAIVEAMLGLVWSLSSGLATAPTNRVRRQVLSSINLILDSTDWAHLPTGQAP